MSNSEITDTKPTNEGGTSLNPAAEGPPVALAPAPATAQAEAAPADDDLGPQPGNERGAPRAIYTEEDEGGDGPAPGNEKFPHLRPPPKAVSVHPAGGVVGGGEKRKRRRRRKKHAGTGAVGAEGGQANASMGRPPDGQEGREGPEGQEQSSASDGTAPDGTGSRPKRLEVRDLKAEGVGRGYGGGAPGDAHAKERRSDDKKKRKKDRPKRDHGAAGPGKEPGKERERPAFNVGDVVFGKIIEITDDAVTVDLSGKARGIFDRHELDLPDVPAPPPPAPEGKAATPEADAQGGSSDGAQASPTEELAPPVEAAAAVEAPAEGGTSETSVEAAPPEDVAPPVQAEAATTTEVAPGTDGETAPEAPPSDASAADRPSRPSPGPSPELYAPPVVLELGANFVGLVHNDGARGGLVVLTRHPERASRTKPLVAAAMREKKPITGLVTGVIKGGVEVDIDGLRAFAPGSHMDLRLGADLHPYLGKRLEFLVTQYGKRGRDVVLSRRAVLETEHRAQREAAIAKLEIGGTVDGVVTSVVDFGAFVDVGGVEGLIHRTEMSHDRNESPQDIFKSGETVKVKILRVDEKGKVWLSRKATIADPWMEAMKKYAVGSRHTGKVVRLQPFGAFVELESGIDGLIHSADLSVKRIEHPSEVVKEGEAIEVVVSSLDSHSKKIGLHPAPTGTAAQETPQRVQLHKSLKVAVVAIDPGGLVVRVLGATGRHARGFITAAATGTPRGTELRKLFPIGKELEAKVIEMDPRRGELKLSIKALAEDTERSAYQQYRQKVNREAKFGTFADLLAKKNPLKSN